MRKWMRDRLKRQKKEPEAGKAEPAQAPLQPAYYDSDAANPASATEANKPEAVAVQKSDSSSEVRPAAVPAVASQPTRAEGSEDPRRRRRRGRGGRGRRGPQTPGVVPLSAASRESGSASSGPALANLESAPTTQAPVIAAHQAPKGAVILAIGLPGSGKSSWFKRHKITPLSSDLLRALLFDDPTEQRFQDLIFSNLRSMLKARLIARRPLNYVDATNLTPHERHSWIKLAQDYGYEVEAVFFDVPLEVCLERNQRRQRVVGEDVMRRMSAKLRPPTFEEGFAKITMVKVKKKE
jgi:predicted kinase